MGLPPGEGVFSFSILLGHLVIMFNVNSVVSNKLLKYVYSLSLIVSICV